MQQTDVDRSVVLVITARQDAVRKELERRGLSMEALAAKMGLSLRLVQMTMAGSPVTRKTQVALLAALPGLTADDLFTVEHQPAATPR